MSNKAYIVTVDMGYGHQRAVYPLKDIASIPKLIPLDSDYPIINANNYPGITTIDKGRWEGGRKLYETISRMKKLPVIGNMVFGIMDYVQRIEPFYPKRDLTRPTAQLKQIYRMMKRGWGKDLIEKLNQGEILPYITSFFTTAYFAEYHGYKGEIYCLCTDTDVSRAWAPLDPGKSRIKYLAPNNRVAVRLELYGVKKENIFVTGFPLPKENIGHRENAEVLRSSLGCRLQKLDPNGIYMKKYEKVIDEYLGRQYCSVDHSLLTITYAVGGAGAQRDIGVEILKSLASLLQEKKIRLNLVAGSRKDVFSYYQNAVKELGLSMLCNDTIFIIFSEKKFDYFHEFNKILLNTDILWTKPSELSFYAGLGLPIIMAPTIGSQEEFNKEWLHSIGSGVEQEDAHFTHEWLFDWLGSGWLAQAAMEGFMDAPRNGTFAIEDLVLRGIVPQGESGQLL